MVAWPDHSQESRGTKEVCDYRVQLGDNHYVRSTKLQLGAYSTETSVAVIAWVLLAGNVKEQTAGAVGGGGQTT